MPSGHVGYSGAATFPHAIWAKKLVVSILIAVYGVGMMYVRMFLGLHYATDVLVGNIIAVGGSALSFLIFQRCYKDGEISRKKEWLVFLGGFLIIAVNIAVIAVFSL